MKKTVLLTVAAVALLAGYGAAFADTSPDQDLKTWHTYFDKKFPGVDLQEYSNGVYAIDKVSRDSWEAIEEFPPYEPMIEDGEAMWNKPFANGKTYASCFHGTPAVADKFPYWDLSRKMVISLPLAINECRKANGEKPLKYAKGPITRLLAYMAYESRGQVTDVKIPNKAAMAAYKDGRRYYFTRRGQLNFSCATCHVQNAGMHVRTDILSPALGHTTGWPVYRSKWGDLGTLHRRFKGCHKQMRAKPPKPQIAEMRNLEYFLTYMSNGIEYNGPSARK
ncbi:MAG: sulfur oxidation c-type cytochrome SoxA [gamma proteobacterium symbiont of Bathyaustriella thionipta]|nr:sulfur oxidation c-type cytochrome SoxA [gamma proteobacterium symbiont of Bathyaustriella thionipta]